MNWTLSFLHGGSLEITLTVPLKLFIKRFILRRHVECRTGAEKGKLNEMKKTYDTYIGTYPGYFLRLNVSLRWPRKGRKVLYQPNIEKRRGC